MTYLLLGKLGLNSKRLPSVASSFYSTNGDDNKLIEPRNFNKELRISPEKQRQSSVDEEKNVIEALRNSFNYNKTLDHKPKLLTNVDVLIIGGGIIGTLTVRASCPSRFALQPHDSFST